MGGCINVHGVARFKSDFPGMSYETYSMLIAVELSKFYANDIASCFLRRYQILL